MSILSPSKLETVDYGQQFWQAILTANAQKLNDYFNKISGLWDGTATNGQTVVYDSALGKFKPSAIPYPVPQASVAVTIGSGADTTINTTLGKSFTLSLTKVTNLVFSNFSTGMVVDLFLTQDSTGGWLPTSSGNIIVGTIETTAGINTWLRVFKVGTSVYINVVANFTAL
jgi:hypothetical protein